MAELSISLLGSFAATVDGEPLTQFRTKSVQALLAYLVCEAERPSSREVLMDLLWPGMPQTSAQANMRQTLYRLRKIIPEVKGKNGDTAVPFLLSNRQTMHINPEADYFADIQRFVERIDTNPEQAIELYRGDFLSDFYLPDSETFEAWAARRREGYRGQVLAVMEGVTAVYIQNANYNQAIQLAQRQLAIDNLRESSHRQLMEAWARNGRRQEALSHYNHLCQLLQDELAIEPEAETVVLIEAIRAGKLSRTAPVTALPSSSLDNQPEPPKHNLPQRLTSFIGREKEMATITKLLNQHRLVMLTGVGGIGKTNLCLQVGRKMLDAFPDGGWLVELASISDPNLIPQTTASALGLRESGERPVLQSLLDYLQDKQCLLILDNCEHLINGVAQIVQTIMQRCAGVKILASSREVLSVPGERPFHVPPLTVPDNDQQSVLEEWEQYEAVHLFVERGQIVLPDFQVTSDNVASLVKICQRLDGIPLALELAAARIKVLTTTQIAERLDDRFRLLTGGSRAALPRQQTLRALIDWSWDLLTKSERLLLQRLSVFAGGMTLEAVEVICAGDDLQPYEILDSFSELINKSMVISKREQGQDARYHLLETIRQYAQERLATTGEAERYRQNHLTYFLQFTNTAEPALRGSDQGVWLDRLEEELDNIRSALDWAQERDVAAGVAMISALAWFCWARGYWQEMDTRLASMLLNPQVLDSSIEAKALWTQGVFNLILYQDKQAAPKLEESLALYRKLGDSLGIARALRYLGFALNSLGQVDKGQSYLKESLQHLRQLENKSELAETLTLLGEQETKGNNYELAELYLQEGQWLFREANDLARLSWNLGKSGVLALQQGNYEAAQLLFEESLTLQNKLSLREGAYTLIYLGGLYYQLGKYSLAQTTLEKVLSTNLQTEFHGSITYAFINLGYIHLHKGELSQARQLFAQSLQQFITIADRGSLVMFAIEGFASLAIKQNQPLKAAQLFAWADTKREHIQEPRRPSEQADVDRETTAILQMIGEERYAAAYAAGRAMTMEEAIALSQTI